MNLLTILLLLYQIKSLYKIKVLFFGFRVYCLSYLVKNGNSGLKEYWEE